MWSILRRVLQRWGYREHMSTKWKPLSSVLAEVPGCWVAVDRATNEPRAVAENPYELTAKIRQQGLTGVAIVRAPDPSEPELVGLG